jgi:hypothetical protein
VGLAPLRLLRPQVRLMYIGAGVLLVIIVLVILIVFLRRR